jgi:hypothetical protein
LHPTCPPNFIQTIKIKRHHNVSKEAASTCSMLRINRLIKENKRRDFRICDYTVQENDYVLDTNMRQQCTKKISFCHKTLHGRNIIDGYHDRTQITALFQFLISSVSQHVWPSYCLAFCNGIFKWLQHSWTHISRSYVYKNDEVWSYQALEGYLASDFEVLVCWESNDKNLD